MLSEETRTQLILSLLGLEDSKSKREKTFLKLGGKYLFRTVTMIYTGEIVDMVEDEIKLKTAAWIADTGRWTDNLKSCEFNEVEPYLKEVVIFRGALLDVTEIPKLPTEQK